MRHQDKEKKGYKLDKRQQTREHNISAVFLLVPHTTISVVGHFGIPTQKPISGLISPSVWFTFQQGAGLRPVIFAFDFSLSETLISTSSLPLCSLFLPPSRRWPFNFSPLPFSPAHNASHANSPINCTLHSLDGGAGCCSVTTPPTPPSPQPRGTEIRHRSYIISCNCRGDRVS